MRTVITRVLPVPAPASTSTGPSVVVTARRCSGFREARIFKGRGGYVTAASLQGAGRAIRRGRRGRDRAAGPGVGARAMQSPGACLQAQRSGVHSDEVQSWPRRALALPVTSSEQKRQALEAAWLVAVQTEFGSSGAQVVEVPLPSELPLRLTCTVTDATSFVPTLTTAQS